MSLNRCILTGSIHYRLLKFDPGIIAGKLLLLSPDVGQIKVITGVVPGIRI